MKLSGGFRIPPRIFYSRRLGAIIAQAASELGEPSVIRRALGALEPARQERAAGSGVVDLGRVDHYLGLLEVGWVSA